MENQHDALIVGAGIGGLTAGIALRQAGRAVQVFERAPDLRAAGAGLMLWPNALNALRRLGLADAVIAAGAPIRRMTIRTWQGHTLSTLPIRELERKFGAPNVGIHRIDLQNVLLGALGEAALRLDARCTGFALQAGGVTARFADGCTVAGDLLVGADGIHSAIRAQLWGNRAPRYADYTAWRGVAAFAHPLLPPDEAFEAWGQGLRFGALPVGQGRIYWFVSANAPEGMPDPPDGRKPALLARFGGWPAPIADLIAATDEAAILRNDVYDWPPLPRWGAGRVTLLGDAAHAATPNLAQGACQAIEDAVVLAQALASGQPVPVALRQYEARRIPRTTRIVNRSWQAGRVASWEHPLATCLRDFLARTVTPAIQARELDWLAGYHIP